MERHPTLFWTPCAAHFLNLMLEDMGKMSFIKEVVNQARTLTKFIYNHAFVLSVMRRFKRNKELLHPTITRFSNSFISLQSILQSQFELKEIFVYDEWCDCAFNLRRDGTAIAKLMYINSFWEGKQ